MDEAREHARLILQAMLSEANPQKLMRRILRERDHLVLPDGSRVRLAERAIRCIAVGKAAGGMAAHAQPWGPFTEALVAAHHDVDVPGFHAVQGGHPFPTEASLDAGARMLQLARATGPDDLLILLLSGGASALAESTGVPLADLRRMQEMLLRSGATIAEINCVRRHLSELKGGGLARACRGELLVLAISDVEPEDLASLGSGPACADPTTHRDAIDVLGRHGLLESAPTSIRDHLAQGARRAIPETVKPGDPCLARVRTFVLADNATALDAGARNAAALGYEPRVLPGCLRGEARERGSELAITARELAHGQGGPVALLAGGETTVHVTGQGRGGRNQEVALGALSAISSLDVVLVAIGTDGRDGPTDAAGAIVDGLTLARALALGLDPAAHLLENDSYPFFDALDDLVRTGPTGTNVRDVAVVLVRRG
jgi:glycerate-2-kinase